MTKRVAIIGAGHVGRALAAALAPLPVAARLIDSRAEELARTTGPTTLTAIPEGFLPSRATAPSAPDAATDDPAHDEYNRLLAELAGSEQTEETK